MLNKRFYFFQHRRTHPVAGVIFKPPVTTGIKNEGGISFLVDHSRGTGKGTIIDNFSQLVLTHSNYLTCIKAAPDNSFSLKCPPGKGFRI